MILKRKWFNEELLKLFSPQHPYSPCNSVSISNGIDKENLFGNQELLNLVIIYFILMTLTVESKVLL